MTVHIPPMGAVALVMGVLATYSIIKIANKRHPEGLSVGDLVGAIGAGAAVFTVLFALLGVGGNAAATGDAGTSTHEEPVTKTTESVTRNSDHTHGTEGPSPRIDPSGQAAPTDGAPRGAGIGGSG